MVRFFHLDFGGSHPLKEAVHMELFILVLLKEITSLLQTILEIVREKKKRPNHKISDRD